MNQVWLLVQVLLTASAVAVFALWSGALGPYVGLALFATGYVALFFYTRGNKHARLKSTPALVEEGVLSERVQRNIVWASTALVVLGMIFDLMWLSTVGVAIFFLMATIPLVRTIRTAKTPSDRLPPALMLMTLMAFLSYMFSDSLVAGWIAGVSFALFLPVVAFHLLLDFRAERNERQEASPPNRL